MESYIDNPALDDSPRAHPAFWRGKVNGIDSMLKIVHDIMTGADNGTGANNHQQIERMRRALLSWRDQLDAATVKAEPEPEAKAKK